MMKRTPWLTSGLFLLLALFPARNSHTQGIDTSANLTGMAPAVLESRSGTSAVEIDGPSVLREKAPGNSVLDARLTSPGINWNNLLVEQRERLRGAAAGPENAGSTLHYKNLPHRRFEAWDTAWFYERLAEAESARPLAASQIENLPHSGVGQRFIPEPETARIERPRVRTESKAMQLDHRRQVFKESTAKEWNVPAGNVPPLRFSAGTTVIQTRDMGTALRPGFERTVYGLEARANLYEFLDSQMMRTRHEESRGRAGEIDQTALSNRLVLQNTASFNHLLGEGKLHANYESASPAGLEDSMPVPQSGTFSFSNRFSERLHADASVKTLAATGARNPAASVTVKPFSPGPEVLKNIEITTKYEEANKVSAGISERDVLSFFLRNQYRGWKAHYHYRNSKAAGPLDLRENEQKHRMRLDYGLEYKDIDVSPYASVDVGMKDAEGQAQELRVGTDLSRDLERRYRMNMQLFCGVAKKADAVDRQTISPLTGMGLSINLASGLHLTGSVEMTAPAGNKRPGASGDVELRKTF